MRTRRRKLKRKYRIMKRLYRTMVAVSATIVVLYIAGTLALRPPEIAQAVNEPDENVVSNEDGTTDNNPSVDESGKKVRKELCYTFLLAANDDGNGNADTIMVMTYDVPNQKIGVVSVPRDTVVKTSRGVPKINAAYNKGIDVLQKEVSNLVGFPIDFYISVDMEAFVALVDAVGGVNFDVPIKMYYDDPRQDLSIHYSPGNQHLNGQQALEVARFRKNNDLTGYPDSDIGRTRTQHSLMATVADKVISWNNFTKVNQLIGIFNKYVDSNMSLSDMAFFAKEGMKFDTNTNLKTTTLPGDGDKRYKGYSWCYELYPEESLAILNEYVNPYTEALTLEDVNFLDVPG